MLPPGLSRSERQLRSYPHDASLSPLSFRSLAGGERAKERGDSGSLIFDEGHLGVGLLFAGGDSGGSNDKGLTYANPLKAVLDALKVNLLF